MARISQKSQHKGRCIYLRAVQDEWPEFWGPPGNLWVTLDRTGPELYIEVGVAVSPGQHQHGNLRRPPHAVQRAFGVICGRSDVLRQCSHLDQREGRPRPYDHDQENWLRKEDCDPASSTITGDSIWQRVGDGSGGLPRSKSPTNSSDEANSGRHYTKYEMSRPALVNGARNIESVNPG